MLCNLALRRPLAVLDLETTGLDTKTDRIVEITIQTVRPNRGVEIFTRRINPGMPIPEEATAVHGINDADVAGEPRFEAIAPLVLARLDGCDLCGFNIKRFDLQLLYNEFRRAGCSFSLEGRALIDPLEIYHHYERRDLAAAVRFYLHHEHEDAHSTAADVAATAEVLNAMLDHYTDLPRDVEGLHTRFFDAKAVDSGGFFTRIAGEVRFARGKYRGQPLDFIARTSPDYLDWMLNADFFDDTKAVVRAALRRCRVASPK